MTKPTRKSRIQSVALRAARRKGRSGGKSVSLLKLMQAAAARSRKNTGQ